MGSSSSTQQVFDDLKADAIAALVKGAQALLLAREHISWLAQYRTSGGRQHVTFRDDQNYTVVNHDTDNYLNVQFNRLYGYQFMNKFTSPPRMMSGKMANAISNFTVLQGAGDPNLTTYVTSTFTALLYSDEAKKQVVNQLTQNASAMALKGNTDWEDLKQQFYVKDVTPLGTTIVLQFDMLSTYASAIDSQNMTFIQYIAVYYQVDMSTEKQKEIFGRDKRFHVVRNLEWRI